MGNKIKPTNEEIENMNCDMVCLECGSSERDNSGFGGIHGHGPDGWDVSFTCAKCGTHNSKEVIFSENKKIIKLDNKLYKELFFDTKMWNDALRQGIKNMHKDNI